VNSYVRIKFVAALATRSNDFREEWSRNSPRFWKNTLVPSMA